MLFPTAPSGGTVDAKRATTARAAAAPPALVSLSMPPLGVPACRGMRRGRTHSAYQKAAHDERLERLQALSGDESGAPIRLGAGRTSLGRSRPSSWKIAPTPYAGCSSTEKWS